MVARAMLNSSDTHNASRHPWLSSYSRGYCAKTEGPGDCLRGDRGSWALAPQEVRTWGQAATACVAHCGQCQRCQHVSVSRHWSDCSWFHACDYTKLQSKVNGFRSGRVLPSMIDFSRAVKAARQSSLLKSIIALDSERGVARVVRNCRRDERGRRVLVTIAANSRGVAPARRVRAALLSVGGPMALLLAPDVESCTEPGAVPCAYTTKFAGWGGDPPTVWDQLMRLRTYYLAVFFARGLDVMQLDSDLAVFSNPFPHISLRYEKVGLLTQRDSPLANTGIVYAQHVSAASDAVVTWLLEETSNRLVWSAPGTCGPQSTPLGSTGIVLSAKSEEMPVPCGGMKKAANDQSTMNDLIVQGALGCACYLHGTLLPEGDGDQERAGALRTELYDKLLHFGERGDSQIRSQGPGCSAPWPKDWKGMVPSLWMRGPRAGCLVKSGGLHYSVGEAALLRLRPRARQIPDVARPALLNASMPRAAARALWAQASSEFFGHWDAEIFSDASRCANWFTQTPSVCDAPLAFLHMAGYGNKKFRPMLLRLLSKRRANFSAAVAHGVCVAMAEVIADIDHRNGNR